MYDAIGGEFNNEREFKAALDEATQKKYSCLLYIQDADNIEDKYMTYLAPDKIPNIKFIY